MLREALPSGPAKGKVNELQTMLADYYEARNWTADGIPTQEKLDEVIKAISDGSLNVFDTSKFTVGGQSVTTALAIDTDGDFVPDQGEAVWDGVFHESEYPGLMSAPYFNLAIDGITRLNEAY